MNPKIAAWIEATRPRVFTASFVPMALAAVIAVQDNVFDWFMFLLALIGVMFLQTTANLVNEYMDFKRGSDVHKQAGQSMALQNKLLTEREVLFGAIFSTLPGIAIGLYLLSRSGPWLWAIGIGGVMIAIHLYREGFSLAYNGLGQSSPEFSGTLDVLLEYHVMQPTLRRAEGTHTQSGGPTRIWYKRPAHFQATNSCATGKTDVLPQNCQSPGV